VSYPLMYPVRQAFTRERESDVDAAVQREFNRITVSVRFRRGARVGITVGSRGIHDIARIARALVGLVKDAGAAPFIFPAMGSHGGATAEGQAAVLRHYGVTEESMGCPVISSLETVSLGQSAEGIPVYLDRHAAEADHVIVLNRVKPHTEFKGRIESGLAKMLLIGMGKCEGARIYHRAFADLGFDRIVESVMPIVLEKARVLFGLAVVENAYDETALLRALLPGEMLDQERLLLLKAKELAPALPFDDIDVLIVDEMGKNVSGAGLDTNVIGRFYNLVAHEPPRPRIKRIYVRDITPESMGNATGIGLADFVHRRVVEKVDPAATRANCLTASNPEKARIPIACDSDREALRYCFETIGLTPPEKARVIRIQNTLRLDVLQLSFALMELGQSRQDLTILANPEAMDFDASGELARDIEGRHTQRRGRA
jgi:Lactate racemase N-terminal domain